MGLFGWTIKVDFEDKIIRIKDPDSPGAVAELIRKEFTMRSSDAPIELIIEQNKTTLKILHGWKFDRKTVDVMKQKDERRYRNFRKSDTTSISSEFRRV